MQVHMRLRAPAPCCSSRRVAAVPPATASRRAAQASRRVALRSSADSLELATSSGPEEPPPAITPAADGYMSMADIKAALLDSLYGTERGLAARSEVRAEINELISQLEARNPTPNPTEVLDRLDGTWKMVYTSNSELIAVLALSKLPFVTVGDITQRIDNASLLVENKVQLQVPFSRTAVTTTASFEVRSPKRLQLKLEKGTVQTPELLSDIELPSNITVLGQAIDLTQVKGALQPVQERVRGLLTQVNNLISQAPELSIPVQRDQVQTWQLNTYVDEDTRIVRGDGGSIIVFSKDVGLH